MQHAKYTSRHGSRCCRRVNGTAGSDVRLRRSARPECMRRPVSSFTPARPRDPGPGEPTDTGPGGARRSLRARWIAGQVPAIRWPDARTAGNCSFAPKVRPRLTGQRLLAAALRGPPARRDRARREARAVADPDGRSGLAAHRCPRPKRTSPATLRAGDVPKNQALHNFHTCRYVKRTIRTRQVMTRALAAHASRWASPGRDSPSHPRRQRPSPVAALGNLPQSTNPEMAT